MKGLEEALRSLPKPPAMHKEADTADSNGEWVWDNGDLAEFAQAYCEWYAHIAEMLEIR